MVRVVIEIPKAFAAHCKAIGDNPRDVIFDLIDELLDPVVDCGQVQAEAPPPKPAGRGFPDIAEFLREPG